MEQPVRMPQGPTMDEYSDYELFGPRIDSNRLLERLKTSNDSECVLFSLGTFADKEKYKLKDLVRTDNRLAHMVQGLKIVHPWPIQRYAWPKINSSPFATLFVSPEATGKTEALLLYLVSKCILASPIGEARELVNNSDENSSRYVPTGHSDLEEFVIHPKYIIISSSQDNVDAINHRIDLMKLHAYDETVTDTQRRLLSPIARAVHVHQDDATLGMHCNGSEILISDPRALIKCLDKGLLHFTKCNKVFFDDLDIAMQTQNDEVREIIMRYIRQTDDARLANTMTLSSGNNGLNRQTNPVCQMHMFSRKWTSLVRSFVTNVFKEKRNLLFTSLAEAAIYTDVRFDIQFCENDLARLTKISDMLNILLHQKPIRKIAIVCRTDSEAEATSRWLGEHKHSTMLFKADDEDSFAQPRSMGYAQRISLDNVFVISDAALEFEVEYSTRRRPLNDITHLIHAYIPDDMLTFDQRFRVLYKNIQDSKPGMTSTIILDNTLKSSVARKIYDLISRSGETLLSTKLEMRDIINQYYSSDIVCWRWATTGLCRLEKLSSNDQFGSYCFNRHSFSIRQHNNGSHNIRPGQQNGRLANGTLWPSEGLIKLTITHIVSPSEYYFWFESIKSSEDGKWSEFNESGENFMKSLQNKLNPLKSRQPRSVALENIKRGQIYGVYFPELCRVDRVRLLDDLNIETKKTAMINRDLEYSKHVRVIRIDYGMRLEVYVKNLIDLSDEIRYVPAQAHRGFQLGYKPVNKIKWSNESNRKFCDIICRKQEKTINAWLRFNCDGNFWFEKMLVSWRLSNIDSPEVHSVDPHRQLLQFKLARATSDEPLGLPASNRIRVYREWEQQKLIEASQYAFIDQSASSSMVYLHDVTNNLDVLLSLVKFNKQLRQLEDELSDEFVKGKLEKQEYFQIGTICLAKIDLPGVSINRVKVVNTILEQAGDIESPDSAPARQVTVECLDHGDIQDVPVDQLYKAELAHITKLPFQIMKRKIANLNQELLSDPGQVKIIGDIIVYMTKDHYYKELVCKLNAQGAVYLYLPKANGKCYTPLCSNLLEHNIILHRTIEEEFSREIETKNEYVEDERLSVHVGGAITILLREMVIEEMNLITREQI